MFVWSTYKLCAGKYKLSILLLCLDNVFLNQRSTVAMEIKILNQNPLSEEEGYNGSQPHVELARHREKRWSLVSMNKFEAAEAKLLSYLSMPFETKLIPVEGLLLETIQLNTLIINKSNKKIPFVFLHGTVIGIGSLPFALNTVGTERPVYAIDLPGFGRSSRIQFPSDAIKTEELFVQIIEDWRNSLGLDRFIIGGYSLGGFLATAYAIKYPDRIAHLVSVDPWGYPEEPSQLLEVIGFKNPWAIKIINFYSKRFNFMAHIRALGPLGWAVSRVTLPGLGSKIGEFYGAEMKEAMLQYIYHCQAHGKPSGETALRKMSTSTVYAKNSLSKRLKHLPGHISVTIVYAEQSFLPRIPPNQINHVFNSETILNIYTLPSTTHDNVLAFSELGDLISKSIVNE